MEVAHACDRNWTPPCRLCSLPGTRLGLGDQLYHAGIHLSVFRLVDARNVRALLAPVANDDTSDVVVRRRLLRIVLGNQKSRGARIDA